MPFDCEFVKSQRPQNTVHYFATLPSTMTEAARLIESGTGSGAVIVAEEQTAGIGRLGRGWLSQREQGLYTSIVLSVKLPRTRIPVASLLIGLAAAGAIERTTSLACDLRWPNDVLLGERKVAGILPQLVGEKVVAGVGINVNQPSFPDDLRTPATSLYMASGQRHSREQLLVALLDSLDSFAEILHERGTEAIIEAFSAASSYVHGRQVIVEESGLRGTTSGLNDDGFLLVRGESGRVQTIYSGGVRPAGKQAAR